MALTHRPLRCQLLIRNLGWNYRRADVDGTGENAPKPTIVRGPCLPDSEVGGRRQDCVTVADLRKRGVSAELLLAKGAAERRHLLRPGLARARQPARPCPGYTASAGPAAEAVAVIGKFSLEQREKASPLSANVNSSAGRSPPSQPAA